MHHSARRSTTSRDAARLAEQRRGFVPCRISAIAGTPYPRAACTSSMSIEDDALLALPRQSREHHGERRMGSDVPEGIGVAGEGG